MAGLLYSMNTFFIRLIKYKTEQLLSTLKYSLDLW